jgi:hypothetical protein
MIPSLSNEIHCLLSFVSCISDDHLPINGTGRAESISLENRLRKSLQITTRLHAFHTLCIHFCEVNQNAWPKFAPHFATRLYDALCIHFCEMNQNA